MPVDQENPSAHEPALSRDHAAGTPRETLSPAERALAPESDAPMQSASGVADDGTYVGRAGGYAGASASPATGSDLPGEGTYGFPAGPEVGLPGGEHAPAGRQSPTDEVPARMR